MNNNLIKAVIIRHLILQVCLVSSILTLRAQEKADLILTNGYVYTVNKNQPVAESIAIKGDGIIDIGSYVEISKYKGTNTQIIDCKGQFVMPGFIEGHGHIHGLAESLFSLDLTKAKNWNEIVNL